MNQTSNQSARDDQPSDDQPGDNHPGVEVDSVTSTPDATPNATLHWLRRRIVQGFFEPGSRLPTRRMLLRDLGVGPVTLQRALDLLEEEGFVKSIDRVGSFVSDQPPHLARYPVVFMTAPSSPFGPWTRFWQLMRSRTSEVAQKSGKQLPVYLGIDGHQDNEDYQSLLRDVHYRRMAGLIFPENPWVLENTPLLLEPGIPRVAIAGAASNVDLVVPDFQSFFARAVQYLAERGRKRVAFLVADRQLAVWKIDLDSLLQEHGLQSRPEWVQTICGLDSARTVLHLLMSPRFRDRPDAVVLADDNWIDHATAGLLAAGVHYPYDLEVITHCNFPHAQPRVMQFKRLGWDVRHLLSASLDMLAEQREGRKELAVRKMPAMFDHELESAEA